jgi:hypothetical protein
MDAAPHESRSKVSPMQFPKGQRKILSVALVQHSWAERPDAAHQNLMDIEKQIRSVTKGAYNKSPDWAAGA